MGLILQHGNENKDEESEQTFWTSARRPDVGRLERLPDELVDLDQPHLLLFGGKKPLLCDGRTSG